MGHITLFVKHPHGRMTLIDPLDPPTAPPPPPPRAGRRPVVALVDAAVGSHPWLVAQIMLEPLSFPSAAEAGRPVDHAEPPAEHEAPVTEHGTFDAGIIRQLAPGAEIVSAAVLRDGQTIAHADVLSALTTIRDRVAGGSAESFVDVVCLPFGYSEADASPEHVTAEKQVLGELAQRGVLVVAAAGNEGSPDKIFPAAFAPELLADGHQMLSVGALDLTGQPADYSGSGPWVTHWEVGLTTSIVAAPAEGYAIGKGTSFAATRVAAKLADLLFGDPTLDDVRPDAAVTRAGRTIARLS